MRALPLLGASLLVAACDSLPPAPPVAATAAAPIAVACGAPSRPWGSNGCPPAPSAAPAPAAPALPGTVVEVEVGGKVVLPRDAPAGRVLVALMDGPCFQPGGHYLGLAWPGPGGNFLLDVFPPAGTALEACAAIVEPLRRGVSFWGRADRGTMAVAGRGRMLYHGSDITVRRAPEVRLPDGVKLAP
jgi:hypothetical protein